MTVYIDKVNGSAIEGFWLGEEDSPMWFYDKVSNGDLVIIENTKESYKVEIVSQGVVLERGDNLSFDGKNLYSFEKEELETIFKIEEPKKGKVVFEIKSLGNDSISAVELENFLARAVGIGEAMNVIITGSGELVPREESSVE